MRKALVVLIAVLACSTLMVAQDNKAEVFGGYSYVRINTGDSAFGSLNMNGWDAQVSGFFTKNIGITADINGAYKSESGATLKDYAFLFGPTVRVPGEKVTPFVHALFGVSHLTASGGGESASDNAFATALGGGFDVNATKNVAIRVAQVDYLMTRHGSTNQNNFRYSAGVVFKF